MTRRTRPRWRRMTGLVAIGLSVTACHHVIIDGGRSPTDVRYDEEWNLAFANAIYPAELDAAGMCDGYFSRIETRQSFLNLIVSSWTAGWISPMEVRLICGERSGPTGQEGAGDPRTGPVSVEVGHAR